jgi:CMP-N-acetylneuraminic acid synthetase
LRPPELATDAARSVDVLIHVAGMLSKSGIDPAADVYVLLQPTAPLRISADIDGAIALLEESACDSVVSVCRVPSHFAPPWQLRVEKSGRLTLLDGADLTGIITRRQELPETYYRNGAVYAVRRETLLGRQTMYGPDTRAYVMPAERSANIDTLEDLAHAEQLLTSNN